MRLFHPHEERIHACSSLQVVIPKRVFIPVRMAYKNAIAMLSAWRSVPGMISSCRPGKLLVRFVRPGRHRRQVTFCPFP